MVGGRDDPSTISRGRRCQDRSNTSVHPRDALQPGDIPSEELFDQSGLSMVTYDSVDTSLVLLELGVRDFMIEADDSDFTVSQAVQLERRTTVWSVCRRTCTISARDSI